MLKTKLADGPQTAIACFSMSSIVYEFDLVSTKSSAFISARFVFVVTRNYFIGADIKQCVEKTVHFKQS